MDRARICIIFRSTYSSRSRKHGICNEIVGLFLNLVVTAKSDYISGIHKKMKDKGGFLGGKNRCYPNQK